MPGSAHDPPAPSAVPSTSAPTGERRFTEEELALILNRAAERQEGIEPSVPRYSLSDIQEIAAGAGIAPDHIASVAAELRRANTQAGGGILGAPWRFRFEESIEGEVSDEVVAELFDLARRELGMQGDVSEALGTVEWKAQDAFGWTHATVTRRGGRTTIGVLSTRPDAIALIGTAGAMGTIFGSFGLTAALAAVAGLADPIAALIGIVGGTGGTWFAARTTWRRVARGVSGRTDSLGSMLVDAARRAVLDGRVLQR